MVSVEININDADLTEEHVATNEYFAIERKNNRI